MPDVSYDPLGVAPLWLEAELVDGKCRLWVGLCDAR